MAFTTTQITAAQKALADAETATQTAQIFADQVATLATTANNSLLAAKAQRIAAEVIINQIMAEYLASLTVVTSPPITPPSVSTGMPNATNTGYGNTVLTVSGSITTTAAGQIITGKNVSGGINVNHPNVFIHHCKADTINNTSTSLLIEDSVLGGTGAAQAVGFQNYIARRCNVSGTADAFKGFNNVVIENCWVHDLRNAAGDHGDCFQTGGGSNMRLSGNNFGYDDRRTSSATFSDASIFVKTEAGAAIDNVVIENNWLNGGGYTLHVENFGNGCTNVRVTNNKFGPNHLFGPIVVQSGPGLSRPGVVFSGNTDINGNIVSG